MSSSTLSGTASTGSVEHPPEPAHPRLFGYRNVIMAVAVLIVLVPAVALLPEAAHGGLGGGLRHGFTAAQVLTFLAVAVLAAAIKGISGFGYALIATPLAVVLIDPAAAVVVLAVPALMMNLFQVGETGTGWRYLREHWSLVLTAVAGSAVGVFVLNHVKKTPVLGALVGLLLVSYVLWALLRRGRPATHAAHPAALGMVGAVEGFLLGSVNMGPLLPAYLHSFERNARRYIGGMSLVFTLVFAERIVQMLANGLMTPGRLWLGCVISLVTLVGLVAGTALRRWGIGNGARFNAVVLTLLSVTAATILIRAIPHLIG